LNEAPGSIRTVGSLLLVALAGVFGPPAAAIPIAKDGSPLVPIVVPEDPAPEEKNAAAELALYLGSAVGSPFRVIPENDPAACGAAIHVGPTEFAKSIGFDPARLGPEEWRIRTAEGRLVLAGGRPRGTLYAVSRFLEDEVGVRWWTPSEESVPGRPGLRTGPLDRSGSPAFAYRDFHGLDGPPIFRLHLRLNGSETGLASEWGGRIAFGMHGVHTFDILVPPEAFFDSHPEFFAEREGFRVAERSQLCLSEESLAPFLAERLLEIVRDSGARAERLGHPAPRFYDVSANDWGGKCECARCRAGAERAGSDAGPLLALVNRVAAIVRGEAPEIDVTTLAYTWTFAPPRDIRAEEGVVVRVAGYGVRDQIRPVSDPGNARYRDALERWAAAAPGFWVWDYALPFHDRFALPFPNLRVFGPDLRAYRDLGASGIFVQFDPGLGGEMHDLKVWVLAKLAEDPDRDADALVREFLRGYFGPAARHLRNYVRLTERAADDTKAVIRADAQPADFRFLDVDFLQRASLLFDKAERSVRSDPVRARRVRHARAPLDWAVLAFGPAGTFDRTKVAARLRAAWTEIVKARVPQGQREESLAFVDEALERVRRARP
jgi:hypothetical protein